MIMLLAGTALAKPAHAPPFSVWDVPLGGELRTVPQRDLAEIACGTNGGPPSRPLSRLDEFRKCRAETDGLREIYFRYDDELEYRARALEIPTEAALYGGTTVGAYPVVVSMLADDNAIIRGIRIVTDARAELSHRRGAFALGGLLKARFGAGWTCEDHPPAEGERPIGSQFIHQTCTQSSSAHGQLALTTRFLRKKGQRAIDPATGRPSEGAFESLTRFEQRMQ